MGFMDKVKATTQTIAADAKKATAQGKQKIEQSQLRKKADEAAQKLGWLVYRERTDGTPAGAEADSLVAEISSLQSEIAALDAAEPGEASAASTDPAEPAPPTQPEASAGDTPS